jgi:tRNA(fMet)-specific endonuclease VapC
MQYCLDTNIAVDFFRNDSCIVQRMQELEEQNVRFVITPITLSELWRGAYLAPRSEAPIKLVEDLLQRVELLGFTGEACKVYGERFAELKKKGKQTQDFDLMIASISIAHNMVLVTRNEKDFKNIKGLKYVVW